MFWSIVIVILGFSSTVSPVWEDQIIYFIMIDRFANGDTSNDVLTESGIDSGYVNSKYNGGTYKV